MDRLKHARGQFEVPICPNCQIGMRWFRSELVRDNPPTMIAHLFVCPNCKRAQRQDREISPVCVSPGKLASPRLRVVGENK